MKKLNLFLFAICMLLGVLVNMQPAMAKEGDCQFDNCFVPAPTVLFPQSNSVVWQKRPIISGLTWKATVVEVYLDGQLLPNIRQDNHQDYFATFYVTPTFDLKIGEHTVYAYAKSGNGQWYDWSKESKHLVFNSKFTIKSITLSSGLEAVIPKDNPEAKSPKVGKLDKVIEQYFNGSDSDITTSNGTTTSTTTVAVNDNDNKDDASFIGLNQAGSELVGNDAGSVGKIAGGVVAQNKVNENTDLQPAAKQDEIKDLLDKKSSNSNYEERQATNRRWGVSILLVLLIAGGVWLFVKKKYFAEEVIAGDVPEVPASQNPVVSVTSPEVVAEDDFILEQSEAKNEVDSNSEVK